MLSINLYCICVKLLNRRFFQHSAMNYTSFYLYLVTAKTLKLLAQMLLFSMNKKR
jgi:hypothetical protein